MSKPKLFYTNGSGQLGAFAYLSTRGELALYSRWQPPASKSKYVGPPKRDANGNVLLDKYGRPQRYALAEHWYHGRMCGRRAGAQADRGNAAATRLLFELCPWLFENDPSVVEMLEITTAGAVAVSPPATAEATAQAEQPGIEPPSPISPPE